MPKSRSKSRSKKPAKRVLVLPDLERAKSAVLNSLSSASGQRTYDHAITEPLGTVLTNMGACETVDVPVCASVDHVIVLNEAGLRRVLARHVAYYMRCRTHLALAKDSPEPRAVEGSSAGRIVATPEVGGLHHGCDCVAA